ncbi:nicotinamide mononucleotide transporter [Glaciecola sp. MH2013]|uniref:nicotinamide riboside transporter PnuC n=1 Tax=Glaciecola sp. MH2013 TaxID=2785524 RepID=UPI00189D448A|nr:nicotinamide riboside transporter PnuC [Glaciecola sp. MH2013]MBF7072112.1 nicotinamide mononucleotide transporter [Glaciecola sp. MH2013]
MTFSALLSAFFGTNAVEIIAAISGFICLVLLIKVNIWNFAFGFVQVTLYVWVFYQAKLYADSALHIVYMALQIYGWWNWSRHANAKTGVMVMSMPYQLIALWALVAIVASAIVGGLLQVNSDASYPYPDAFTTCASLVAFVLMTKRYTVNWVFWIVVDVVAIFVYFQKALYPTVALYSCFLVMACLGLYTWSKQSQSAYGDDDSQNQRV